MNADGTAQTPLVRGNSGTWSPDGKRIAFHASASGVGRLVSGLPGAAAADSDIFALSVDDFLRKSARPKNITNNPAAAGFTRPLSVIPEPGAGRQLSCVNPVPCAGVIL